MPANKHRDLQLCARDFVNFVNMRLSHKSRMHE